MEEAETSSATLGALSVTAGYRKFLKFQIFKILIIKLGFMLTPIQACDFLLSLYGDGKIFDYISLPPKDGGVCWGVKSFGGLNVLALRGSKTFQDWFRDFHAFANPFHSNKLGVVHPGFYAGMEETYQDIKSRVSGPIVITGHSLGAARSAILSGLYISDGIVPVGRIAFGEPKPGFSKLAALLSTLPSDLSYRNKGVNGHDLVTDVPFTFPPEEYVHSTKLQDICGEPPKNDEWGPLAWHHLELYRQGLGKL